MKRNSINLKFIELDYKPFKNGIAYNRAAKFKAWLLRQAKNRLKGLAIPPRKRFLVLDDLLFILKHLPGYLLSEIKSKLSKLKKRRKFEIIIRIKWLILITLGIYALYPQPQVTFADAPITPQVKVPGYKHKRHQAPVKRFSKLARVAEPKPVISSYSAPRIVTGITNCGSDPYMAQIYMRESGCRTNAINPIGACGLGQALPCSKMGCSLSDWACQDRFFKNYAISVYGSYANAWAAWSQKHWW